MIDQGFDNYSFSGISENLEMATFKQVD